MATVAWLVPLLATAITMAVRLCWRPPLLSPGDPVLAGVEGGLALWVVIGALSWPLALPHIVNPTSWSAMRVRLTDLRERARALARAGDDDARQVSKEVRRHSKELEKLMAGRLPATRWTFGAGFIEAWERIHHAEEALITAASSAELRAAVDRDRLRIEGADGIATQLSGLLADVSQWLEHDRRRWRRWWPGRSRDRGADGFGCCQAVQGPHHRSADLRDARLRMQQVTATIHELRARNWAGLIHLRNHTMAALVATETIGFALLALAMAARPSRSQLIAAWVYFLVGAAVGLLAHLVRLRSSQVAVDDYGLEEVRLALVPIVSGLAAVAGVLVMAIVTSPGVADLVQVASASAARAGAPLPPLSAVFDLADPGTRLLFAALFGIAPHLVVARLDDLARRYEDAIRSTQLAAAPTAGRQGA